MAMIDIVRGTTHTELTKRTDGNTSSPQAYVAAIQHKVPAQFTATNTYREFQSQMLDLLKQTGLDPEQATQLMDIGKLPVEQLMRVIILSQTLKQNKSLFTRYAHTLRNIMTSGKDVSEGLHSFLDSIEEMLGTSTERLIRELQTKPQIAVRQTPQPQNKVQPQAENSDDPLSEFEATLYSDLQKHLPNQQTSAAVKNAATPQQNMMQALRLLASQHPDDNRPVMSPQQVAQLQSFHDLAEKSIEEFPTRYPVDLFSFAALANKGVSLDNYLKLASEVSPLRLLQLLIVAQKSGQHLSSMIASLVNIQESGGSVLDALLNLEHQYGIKVPRADPATAENVLRLNNKTITINEGDPRILQFAAFDTKLGLIENEKSKFVVFPQKQEYAGQSLNLAFLPVGSYFILAQAASADNVTMGLWIKIIVEKKKKKAEEKLFNAFLKESKEKSKNDFFDQNQSTDKDASEEDSAPGSEAPEINYSPPVADAMSTSFETQPENHVGPFMGEIVLPLDYMSRNPGDLTLISTPTGIVVDPDEFYNGRFHNNAVAFRFLASHIEKPDLLKRHGLITLKQSRLFAQFNDAIKNFVAGPEKEIHHFKKSLGDFFDSLKSIFASGAATFDLARQFFETEAEGLAKGNVNGEIYSHTSLEKNEDKFLSAFYAKGSYLMARAGEVTATLHSMAYATLTDRGNENHRAVLGEYLDGLKQSYYRHESGAALQNNYEMHLARNLNQRLLANPHYKKNGEEFIAAANINVPGAASVEESPVVVAAEESTSKPSVPPVNAAQLVYGLYHKVRS